MRGFRWLLAGLGLSALSAGGQTTRPTLPANRLKHYSDYGPRHWRGTVGRQAVTLELDSGRWGYSGRYCYDQRGRTLYLSQASAESQVPRFAGSHPAGKPA